MGPIVLEGPDSAGKTTLAKQLCDYLGYTYTHEGPPPDVRDLTGHYIKGLLKQTVIDRSALSECVYGPILRGQSRIDWPGWMRYYQALCKRDGTLVICLPSLATCRKAWQETLKDQLIQDDAVMQRVWNQFNDIANGKTTVAIDAVYDWENDTVDALLERLDAQRPPQ